MSIGSIDQLQRDFEIINMRFFYVGLPVFYSIMYYVTLCSACEFHQPEIHSCNGEHLPNMR